MKLTEKILDIATGEECFIEREATASELAEIAEAKLKAQKIAELEAETVTKRAAAEAKLAALGLTVDDLKALGL